MISNPSGIASSGIILLNPHSHIMLPARGPNSSGKCSRHVMQEWMQINYEQKCKVCAVCNQIKLK